MMMLSCYLHGIFMSFSKICIMFSLNWYWFMFMCTLILPNDPLLNSYYQQAICIQNRPNKDTFSLKLFVIINYLVLRYHPQTKITFLIKQKRLMQWRQNKTIWKTQQTFCFIWNWIILFNIRFNSANNWLYLHENLVVASPKKRTINNKSNCIGISRAIIEIYESSIAKMN